MVKVIMGLKGSGKTKQLIDSINSAVKNETGSMVCIEKGNALTFDVDYRVRLIDASEYDIGNYTFLKGFISGLHAGNFDITHIFMDGLYKLSGTSDTFSQTGRYFKHITSPLYKLYVRNKYNMLQHKFPH